MAHRLPLVRSLLGASLAVAAVVGVVAVGGTADTAVEASGSDFVETFDAPGSLDRFDFAIHHPVLSGTPISSWQGDHDTGCGGPTTTRTINLPGNRRAGDGKTYTTDVGDAVYWCAPGGAGTGHVMTSFKTTGYAQIDFSPKQVFDDVRRVCWDQNMTDLGARKWTQLVIVGTDDFLANGSRFDYVGPGLDAGPSALATKLPSDAFLLEVRGGSSTVHSNGRGDSNFRGYVNDDKAKRFTTCVTDLRNGRVEVEFERESGVDKRIHPGSFPDGDVRVIFQDDTYNAPKAPPDKNVPNPFTWHWDNVLVSTSPFTPPPGFVEPPVKPSIAGEFDPVKPARLFDSRPNGATIDGRLRAGGLRGAGSVTEIDVVGRGGVTSGVRAVALNLTAVGAQSRGYATVYSCDRSRPLASNVNYAPGVTIANAVITNVSGSGKVCVYSESAVHLAVDVTGAFPSSTTFDPVKPARLFDSRPNGATIDGRLRAGGLRGAGSVTEIDVAGRGGVANDASAVVLNLTAVGAQSRGYATVYSCDRSRPLASNVNYAPGVTIANAVITEVSASGKICVYTKSAVHLAVDVTGAFPSSTTFDPVKPARLFDSRPNGATIDGRLRAGGLRGAGSVTEIDVAGRGGVANDASAVVLNLTAVGAQSRGYATVYSCDRSRPLASNVNYAPGVTIANAVITEVSASGKICVYTKSAVHLAVDLTGSFPS